MEEIRGFLMGLISSRTRAVVDLQHVRDKHICCLHVHIYIVLHTLHPNLSKRFPQRVFSGPVHFQSVTVAFHQF